MKITIKLLILLILLFSNNSNGQSLGCGTESVLMSSTLLNSLSTMSINENQSVTLPIKIHIIRQNNGTGGVNYSNVQNLINVANQQFLVSGIQFAECETVNYINNTSLYSFSRPLDEANLITHHTPNVINIYYANTVSFDGVESAGGFAFFPWMEPPYYPTPQNHYIIIASGNANNNSATLAHELGHYLGLLHTFEDAYGIELINGSNCLVAGDLICDTPADPYPAFNGCVSNCQYIPSGNCPTFYNPPITNIMSYHLSCQEHFTSEQNSRMNTMYQNHRTYLQCQSSTTNDNCPGTELISYTSCNYLTGQTVNNATASGKPQGACDAYTGTPDLADVWYYFTAQASNHTVTVNPNGSALDAVIVAYSSCNGSEIACSDTPGGNGTISTLNLTNLIVGNEYYIRVYDYGLQTTNGDFQICVTHSGGSSTNPCDNITSINGCGSSYSQTFMGGGNGSWFTNTDNPCGYESPGSEQIYSFVAPATGIYSIQVTSASGWVDYLWKSGSCNSNSWNCIDDISSTGQYGNMSWTAGTTYYILLDDENSTQGTHTFYINCPSGGSTSPCDNIISINGCGSSHSQSFTGTNSGAWFTNTENACGYESPGSEQIYSFVAPVTGIYSIVVSNTNDEYVDYFWKLGSCNSNGWNCIGDISDIDTYDIDETWYADTTYYILLDNEYYFNQNGNHTFYINCPSGGTTSPCDNIISINGCGSSYSQTFMGGGNGSWFTNTNNPCNLISLGSEQIYSFVAPTTGIYSIQVTSASGWVDYMWKSGSCNSNSWNCIEDIISTGQYGNMSWTAGTTYYILLDDEDSTQGTHTFYINCPSSGVACDAPNNIYTTNLTAYSVTLNTSYESNADFYIYNLYNATGLIGSYGSIDNYFNWGGLTPNTTYHWEVQLVCNGVFSDYSAFNYFTTLSETTPQLTYVPDDNFEQALINLGYDDVLDNYVLTSNISNITFLDVSNKNIQDLTGIEDFTALTELNCWDNQLSYLDVSQNSNLIELDCSDNQLVYLNISQNQSLTFLRCGFNYLTSLDISQNYLLRIISCRNNQLTTLNTSNNSDLEVLICMNNTISSLDLTQNINLITLDAQSNSLENISLFQNINLTKINLNQNFLTNLDISNNTLLKSLIFSNNQVTSIDTSNNLVLERLWCHNNQLISIDLSNNTFLNEFYSINNNLVLLNAKNGNNQMLQTFIAFNNPNLFCIDVDDSVSANNGNGVYSNWYVDDIVIFSEDCSLGTSDYENIQPYIYPNPTEDILYIGFPDSTEEIQYKVYSVNGQFIKEGIGREISLKEVQSGLYIINIEIQEKTTIYRVIKK